MNAHTLLLILAVILWFFAGILGLIRQQGSPVQFGWLGMFFYGLSLLVH